MRSVKQRVLNDVYNLPFGFRLANGRAWHRPCRHLWVVLSLDIDRALRAIR